MERRRIAQTFYPRSFDVVPRVYAAPVSWLPTHDQPEPKWCLRLSPIHRKTPTQMSKAEAGRRFLQPSFLPLNHSRLGYGASSRSRWKSNNSRSLSSWFSASSPWFHASSCSCCTDEDDRRNACCCATNARGSLGQMVHHRLDELLGRVCGCGPRDEL